MPPLASSWTDAGGVRMHAEVGGPPDARPVVLVHGMGVSGRYLLPTAELLAARFRVLVPDLPGFGRSGGRPRADTGALAAALAAWLDAAGVGPAAFLANSYGCQVVAELAVREPARVERAVLVGPTADPRARSLLRQAARLARDMPREPLGLWLLAGRDYLRFVLRGGLPVFRELVEHRIEERLPHVAAPVLVVRGEHDPIVPQRWAAEAAALLPDGRLAVVPGAPHAANYAAPDALVRAIGGFLD